MNNRTKVDERVPLFRHYQGALHIRNGDGREGRTVYGCCAPYDRQSGLVSDHDGVYFETFQRGAFGKSVQQRGDKVFLYERHNRSDNAAPIGRPTMREAGPDELYGEFYVPNTREGNDALERVREGIYGGFSVGMVPVNTAHGQPIDGHKHLIRTQVALIEVSLVPEPAYDAPVAGLRSLSLPAETARTDSSEDTPATARVVLPRHQRQRTLYRKGIL